MNYLDVLYIPLLPADKLENISAIRNLKQAGVIMTTLSKYDRPLVSYGISVSRLRKVMKLTRQQVADMAHVSKTEVSLFERNQPVRLDAKRRILKELWATRSSRTI